MRNLLPCSLGILITTTALIAETLHVPSQYPTIQAGIEASQDGDTVLVAAGTYNEQIFYLGKEIVVKSESGPTPTIIDPNMEGCTVNFMDNEGPGAVIEGFTISNSYFSSTGWYSGIRCTANTFPTIRNNIISDNGGIWAFYGGGINADSACPVIEDNIIVNNECVYYGAGIYISYCDTATVRNNTIASNMLWSGYGVATGGGIYAEHSNVLIERNIIIDNTADINYARGGGMAFEGGGNYHVLNNTIAGNHGKGIYINTNGTVDFRNNILVNTTSGSGLVIGWESPTLNIDFNDVWNNFPENYIDCEPGRFDISGDPLFIPGPEHNFYLDDGSPCIDAGSFITEPDPDGTRADIGMQYYDQENVNCAIVPAEWPIEIPQSGGDFEYTLQVTNNTPSVIEFDFWIDVLLPDSSIYGPIVLREGLEFQPYYSIPRDMIQPVPQQAPAGLYRYRAKTGDYSFQQVYHQAELLIVKIP